MRFNIPVDETITFQFYTLDGKMVLAKKDQFVKGQNQISIKGEELSHTGTYFVKMISKQTQRSER
ncbi:MAG: T9SS type A sorting domain-containing protein [Saprospiraceae bacterium]|nr:T9SS type A sorting domain-containing protein [Saprospiraceae bacterium]